MEASRSGNKEMVQLLLGNGANPDQTNSVRTDGDICCMALIFCRSLNSQNSRILNCSRNYFNENFDDRSSVYEQRARSQNGNFQKQQFVKD